MNKLCALNKRKNPGKSCFKPYILGTLKNTHEFSFGESLPIKGYSRIMI
jgi:hypothetical protein